ncbi:hypothetical protein DKX38_026202 [Salix brachista]|uniref:Uncharacterized protein n=1 Tax=Salix brachista TaxID=2182728 RepID=A0A5N5JW27_9ROSI|nr:hypothetical protein DKX38_026202 [Salix brachista]
MASNADKALPNTSLLMLLDSDSDSFHQDRDFHLTTTMPFALFPWNSLMGLFSVDSTMELSAGMSLIAGGFVLHEAARMKDVY